MKKCPFCAEEIQDEAFKCKHCGEFLNGQNSFPYGKCLDCGSPLTKDSNFCSSCGVIQIASSQNVPQEQKKQYSYKKNKSASPPSAIDTDKKKSTGNGWVALFVLLIIPFMIYMEDRGEQKKAPQPLTPAEKAAKQESSDEFDARIYAKEYVKNSLKAPSTAKFQSPANFAVQHLKGGKDNPNQDLWKVSGYVDAQNSFGAMMRNRFYIELVKLGDKWIPLKTVVGE